MLGHLGLAAPTLPTFYLGLLLVITGTGLLKPNVSTMVGQLYGPDDARRDAGFSIYYMGINLGAFVAPFLTGWLAQSNSFKNTLGSIGFSRQHSWHWGFALAAVGMFFGLAQYLAGWPHLGEAGMEPVPETPEARMKQRFQLQLGIAGLVLLGGVILALSRTGVIMLTPELVSRLFGYLLLVVVVTIFAWLLLSRGWTAAERKRLLVILVLFGASSVFWALYEQAGSTLNLFAERNTNSSFLGWSFPSSWFQAVPPLFVIVLAPVFAWLWVRLGAREPSSPAKFMVGLVFVALGFAVLVIPAARGVRASPLWLCLTYFLHVVGELCLSPVGLSATTKLAPQRVQGLMMGVWFLSISVGSYIGGRVASLYEAFPLPQLFGVVAAAALAAAVVLALLLRPIGRMLRAR
jgi:POT family proton-dependent oligopeptide transporter